MMQAQPSTRQHNMAFGNSNVSVGSLVRLGGAAAMAAYASKIKNPEIRYLMFGVIGIVATYAGGIMRERHR